MHDSVHRVTSPRLNSTHLQTCIYNHCPPPSRTCSKPRGKDKHQKPITHVSSHAHTLTHHKPKSGLLATHATSLPPLLSPRPSGFQKDACPFYCQSHLVSRLPRRLLPEGPPPSLAPGLPPLELEARAPGGHEASPGPGPPEPPALPLPIFSGAQGRLHLCHPHPGQLSVWH